MVNFGRGTWDRVARSYNCGQPVGSPRAMVMTIHARASRDVTDAQTPLLMSALARIANGDGVDIEGNVGASNEASISPRRIAVPQALRAAFDLAADPSTGRFMRAKPLPQGMLPLIQIAAGSEQLLQGMVIATGRDPAFIRAAATAYIERVLWSSDGDHYRALGVGPDDRPRKLAQHLLWFAKWVSEEWEWDELRQAFAEKVLPAWNALKSPELRRRYDRVLVSASVARARLVPRGADIASESRVRWTKLPPPISAGDRYDEPAAATWQLAALGASIIAVVAVATLNWIAFQLPAVSAVAPSPNSSVAAQLRTVNLNPPELLGAGPRSVKTFVVRAKDDSRLVPPSGD